jgi:hypothetical protein
MRGIKLITSETVAAVASNLVVVLLVGLLLTISRATSAQSPAEATALNEQVVRLYNQGRYSEATSLAQRVLQIRETLLGFKIILMLQRR